MKVKIKVKENKLGDLDKQHAYVEMYGDARVVEEIRRLISDQKQWDVL